MKIPGHIFQGRPLALAALVLGSTVLMSAAAQATVVTLTMDEVATQLIDGLTVTKGGESFTFSDPGGSLNYDFGGPGSVTYVQDPSIEGADEPFSVSFSTPVDFIQFGLAEASSSALTGASVTLSDGSVHLFDLPLVDPFAEGQFTWSGAPVIGFTLTSAAGPGALAFDNLTVDTAAPEPASVALLGVGLAGLGALRRRKKV